jgi:hypothetical protein
MVGWFGRSHPATISGHIETQMGRWKAVVGHKLKARSFENQKTEAKIGVRILNLMTALCRPNFQRTA